MMKVVFSLVIFFVATTLAVPSSKEPAPSRASSYTGNLSVKLFGESSVQGTLDSIMRAISDALKKSGLDTNITSKSEHKGSGQVQGTLNFSGSRNQNRSNAKKVETEKEPPNNLPNDSTESARSKEKKI